MWLILRDMFESKRPAKKATLLKQITLARMSKNQNMKNHLNNFFNDAKKLRDINVSVGEDLLAILLLYSLPTSCETFRCALETNLRNYAMQPKSERNKIALYVKSDKRGKHFSKVNKAVTQ